MKTQSNENMQNVPNKLLFTLVLMAYSVSVFLQFDILGVFAPYESTNIIQMHHDWQDHSGTTYDFWHLP